jgi:hypothetical protein
MKKLKIPPNKRLLQRNQNKLSMFGPTFYNKLIIMEKKD